MTAATTYEHVILDEDGVPQIAGANTKVIELVLAHQAHGMSPEELAYQLPQWLAAPFGLGRELLAGPKEVSYLAISSWRLDHA